jgi:predicted ATPase
VAQQASSEMDRDRWPAGRRQRLHPAREWLLSGGSVLVFGPAGTGKSAALDVVTAAAVRSRVLRCAPTERDADRRYAALLTLIRSVTSAELDAVPAARRRVLDTGVSGDLDSFGPAAARLAALTLFRVLARSRRLLLVVDDLQWVDEASADALRFVASRVDDVPVHLAAAERVAAGAAPSRRALCPSPLLLVGPEPVSP